MVNIEKINSKLSEIISEENNGWMKNFYPIKRFVINSIENVTVSKERLKLFNYKCCNGEPVMAFKLNVSFTITRFPDHKEISLENIDFIWFADTVNNMGDYCVAYEEKLSKRVWDQEAPETRPDIDKMTKEYTLKLTDLYIENYFTHERFTCDGRHYFFLYCFIKDVIYENLTDNHIFSNYMLYEDYQIIKKLINQ